MMNRGPIWRFRMPKTPADELLNALYHLRNARKALERALEQQVADDVLIADREPVRRAIGRLDILADNVRRELRRELPKT